MASRASAATLDPGPNRNLDHWRIETMATHANSTAAPSRRSVFGLAALPILATSTPPNQVSGWGELLASLEFVPEGVAAALQAMRAGQDAGSLRLINLSGGTALWFGPSSGECAVYGARGFIGREMIGGAA